MGPGMAAGRVPPGTAQYRDGPVPRIPNIAYGGQAADDGKTIRPTTARV
jgi:hypothetical protein